jgi:hypothetical protein
MAKFFSTGSAAADESKVENSDVVGDNASNLRVRMRAVKKAVTLKKCTSAAVAATRISMSRLVGVVAVVAATCILSSFDM